MALINSDLFQRLQFNRDRKRAEDLCWLAPVSWKPSLPFPITSASCRLKQRSCQQILKELERAVQADTMAVILLEPGKSALNIVNATGDLIPSIGFKFDVTEGISGSILKSRQLYQTDDLSNDPTQLTWADWRTLVPPFSRLYYPAII